MKICIWSVTIAIICFLLAIFIENTLIYFNIITPSILYILVFYFGVQKWKCVSSILIFFIGLIFDLVVGYPLGITAISLLIIFIITKYIAKKPENVFINFILFFYIYMGTVILKISTFYFINHRLKIMFFNYLLTILLYPVIIFLLNIINKNFIFKKPYIDE